MEGLISYLKRSGSLRTPGLENALRDSPRERFIPAGLRHYSYMDKPLPLIKGQTISQPTTVVRMTEALDVRQGDNVLEIGTGSGWQTAILAKLAGYGKVYTVERFADLNEYARGNLMSMGIKNVEFRIGDGSVGWKENAPFDRIIVTCAAPRVIETLTEQLKVGGKMVIPVGRWTQELYLITKESSGLRKQFLGFFSFVPLIGKNGFSA